MQNLFIFYGASFIQALGLMCFLFSAESGGEEELREEAADDLQQPGIRHTACPVNQTTCYYIWGLSTSGVKSGLPVVRLDTIQM